ncbi:MAG: hypothetical protein EB060_11510, partial [Proteobacteria bacterium]|nr:hypothetical protein [Pseudomonadota bacterium]
MREFEFEYEGPFGDPEFAPAIVREASATATILEELQETPREVIEIANSPQGYTGAIEYTFRYVAPGVDTEGIALFG